MLNKFSKDQDTTTNIDTFLKMIEAVPKKVKLRFNITADIRIDFVKKWSPNKNQLIKVLHDQRSEIFEEASRQQSKMLELLENESVSLYTITRENELEG